MALMSCPEFCDRLGLSYRIADYWDREGVLRPTRPAAGSGTQRGYSQQDLAIGRVLARLRTLGCGTTILRRVAHQLATLDGEWPPTITIDPRGKITDPGLVCCGSWTVPTGELCPA